MALAVQNESVYFSTNKKPRKSKLEFCSWFQAFEYCLFLTTAKVRLWAGNGRRRLATDVTDLDMVLNTLEDVTMDYK